MDSVSIDSVSMDFVYIFCFFFIKFSTYAFVFCTSPCCVRKKHILYRREEKPIFRREETCPVNDGKFSYLEVQYFLNEIQ